MRALVEQAVAAGGRDAQQTAFDGIVALGCAAVPALGRLLDDRRALPSRSLLLKNRAVDAFEPFRRYAPETVTDALSAILNHLTGHSPAFIYNGASEAERAAAVRAWRTFLAETPADQACRER